MAFLFNLEQFGGLDTDSSTTLPRYQNATPVAGFWAPTDLTEITKVVPSLYGVYETNNEYPIPYDDGTLNLGLGLELADGYDWLSGHFMPWHMFCDTNAGGSHRYRPTENFELSRSTRSPFGLHPDERNMEVYDPKSLGPYFDEKPYKSMFFGKNVDIVAIEAGNPSQEASPNNAIVVPEQDWGSTNATNNPLGSKYINHPDFGETPRAELTITENPYGGRRRIQVTNEDITGTKNNARLWGGDNNYSTNGSRIKLVDWTGSSGGMGKMNSLYSRYNNPNIPEDQKKIFTRHCLATLSAAGGRFSGAAKESNLYFMYGAELGLVNSIYAVIDWHYNKDRNPDVKYGDNSETEGQKQLDDGVRNPTVLIIEMQWTVGQAGYFHPIERISSVTAYGKTTDRPSGGWGNNLKVFTNAHLIPYRMEDPDNAGNWMWVLKVGAGGSERPHKDTYYPTEGETVEDSEYTGEWSKVKQAIQIAWDNGIVVVVAAGNGADVYAKKDDKEALGTYFKTDSNSVYYKAEGVTNGATITGYRNITSGATGDTVYPLRSYGPYGAQRGKSIDVAAGSPSELYPTLDPYTTRGPGIDIVGSGRGNYTTGGGGNEYGVDFPTESATGSVFLNPDEASFGTAWSGYLPVYNSDNPYPLSVGEEVYIVNLGYSTLGQQGKNSIETPLGGWTIDATTLTSSNEIDLATSGAVTPSQASHGLQDGDTVKVELVSNSIDGRVSELGTQSTWFVKRVSGSKIKLSQNSDLSTTTALTPVNHSGNAIHSSLLDNIKYSIEVTSGIQEAWNLYLTGDASTGNVYTVGDKFNVIANSESRPMPNKAKVAAMPIGKQGFYSGTSCAAPTVAGKLACMMEEYLSFYKRWPTPDQTYEMMLDQSKPIIGEWPGIDWGNAPTPNADVYNSEADIKNNYTRLGKTARFNFTTRTGEIAPDTRGWLNYNVPDISIAPNSIASITDRLVTATTVLKDTNDNPIEVQIGNRFRIHDNEQFDNLDGGYYEVIEVNNTQTSSGLGTSSFEIDIRGHWEDAGDPQRYSMVEGGVSTVTDHVANGTEFSLTKIETVLDKGSYKVKLRNRANGSPAGITALVWLQSTFNPIIHMKSSKGGVKIRIHDKEDNVTYFTHNTNLVSGKISVEPTFVTAHQLLQVSDPNSQVIQSASSLLWPSVFGKAAGVWSTNGAVPDTNPPTINQGDYVGTLPPTTGYTSVVGKELMQDDHLDYDATSFGTHGLGWNWTNSSNLGSIVSGATFNDATGNSRTIKDMFWCQAGDPLLIYEPNGLKMGLLVFSLSGTNIPNSSDTFGSLIIDGVSVDRTDAYYSPDSNGNSVWWWHITKDSRQYSQFGLLGTLSRTVSFSVNTHHNTTDIKFTIPQNAFTEGDGWHQFYATISNIGTTEGDTVFLDQFNVRNTHTRTRINEIFVGASANGALGHFSLAGTTNRKIHFDGMGFIRKTGHWRSGVALSNAPESASGAIYPNVSFKASNDIAIQTPDVNWKVDAPIGGFASSPANNNENSINPSDKEIDLSENDEATKSTLPSRTNSDTF